MKGFYKKVFKYIFSFIIVILVFNIGLFLVCSFNSKLIKSNVKESSKVLSKQGLFYNLPFLPVVNNNYTDSIIINESYSVDYKAPFTSYMKARRDYERGKIIKELEENNGEVTSITYNKTKEREVRSFNPVDELKDFLSGKLNYSINYGRYWHGYLILYRPLLIMFNISQIRMFMLVVFTILLGYFLYLLSKRFSKNIPIIYGISLLCSGYFTASYSLESTPIFLVMMISAIIFLKRIDKIKDVYLYIFLVGCMSNFFDFLTVPLITLGMLCSLYLLKLIEVKTDWKKCLSFLITASILWVLGYACTWMTKWVLYDLIISGLHSMIEIGFSQVFYRVQRVNNMTEEKASYIDVIINIIGKSSLYAIATAFILSIVNKFKLFINKSEKGAIAFAIIAFYPIVWYVVLANHTVMHSFFTYRQSFVYMLGVLLFINNQMFAENKNKKQRPSI